MFAVIEKIRKAVRQKELEKVSTGWPSYRKLLGELVEGRDDQDPEEVRLILASVGRTLEDLPEDVDTYRKRLEWVKVYEQGKAAEAQAIKERDALKKLEDELKEVQERLTPLIVEQARKVRELELAAERGETGLSRLPITVMDPGLLGRIAEVDRELGDKQKARDEMAANMAGGHSRYLLPNIISNAADQLNYWEGRVRKTYGADKYEVRQRDWWLNNLSSLRDRKKSIEALVEEMDRELAKLHQERDRLQAETLIP